MPIPVQPDAYQAQVVFPSVSAAEGNSFVNTFFFLDAAAVPRTFTAVADLLETKMETFYNVANPTASGPIRAFMSRAIDWPNVVVKVYNLGAPSPRVPQTRTMELTTPTNTTALPNEVSVVLSYRSGGATSSGGTSDKRKRGRAFIGPLNQSAVDFSAGTYGDARVAAGLVDSIARAGEFLMNETDDLIWQQYSRVGNLLLPVSGGFVNNRFDTLRSRGEKLATRQVWSGV